MEKQLQGIWSKLKSLAYRQLNSKILFNKKDFRGSSG